MENGFYLGHEPSGYVTQVYDIAEYLNYGEENLMTVRADATLAVVAGNLPETSAS
ncbi:hypothetical protein [uncultured Bacteroides sp.]|uniref:hypothetical protein n=1 Tax=uncultured Bacteroides sp. TaxID=162156 RepID=UPI0025CE14CA|nr:hypothetical protein [uncultured Bacteroides sp.]